MTRLVAVTAAGIALLLAAPIGVALAFAAVLPAVLTPVLGGADDVSTAQTSAPSSRGQVNRGGQSVVLRWASAHVGQQYRMGAAGPAAWDCSSFTQAAYAQAGVHLPRTAQEQRDWLAAGHGSRIPPGAEQPADLVFWDSYLGPHIIGHVVLVDDPRRRRTVEAHNTRAGTGYFTYHSDHHRYEIWRPHLLGPSHPDAQRATAEARGAESRR